MSLTKAHNRMISGSATQVVDYGALGNGTTDNTAAIQAAVDAAQAKGGDRVEFGSGNYRIDGTVDLQGTDDVKIHLGGAELQLYDAVSSFDYGWGLTAIGTQAADVQFEGGRITAKTANTTVFRIQNAYAPIFRDINLKLEEAGQTGFSFRGNPAPYIGPYYGVMDNIRIFGNATPGDLQYGMRFFGADPSFAGSDGVNRWCFSNIRHIAAVDYGVDIINMQGDVWSNVNFEACYNTAIRFNERSIDYLGSVTTAGSTQVITDSAYTDIGGGSVIMTSGPNNGLSAPVLISTNGSITLAQGFPNEFTFGDTYTYYLGKARNVRMENVTVETAGKAVDFSAGGSDNRVEFAFITIEAASPYFTRDVEDISNTIARRYDVFEFEGTVPTGGGAVWLSPTHISSTRGGAVLPETGFIDAIYCTSSTRGVGGAGNITVVPYSAGITLGSDMTITLTSNNPSFGGRVRKSLTSSEFTKRQQSIKVLATGDAALATDESIRVQIYVGYL
jgi:hypothetical protein|tara:strand:+ start:344 stop:1852 length:1509 start_codon:yes stop_codon:yes gene_type:complete